MEKDWFKDRGYPHFSNRTPVLDKSKIEKYISDPAKISKHSFYPLILKQIKQRRYKNSNFGNAKRRSHKTYKNGTVVSNAKIRDILYSTHIDAHIYSYYAQEIISDRYEEYLSERTHVSTSISAYRQIPTFCKTKFKNNAHFAKDVFDEIRRRKDCIALAFDIENFFPSLDHKLLKQVWAKLLGKKALPPDHYNIFKAVTKFSYVRLTDLKVRKKYLDEKKLAKLRKNGKSTFFDSIKDLVDSEITVYKNQKKIDGKLAGIPQGLPISALLANIYMLPFDEALIDGLSNKHNVFYRRYSDDIVVVCEPDQREMVEDFVKAEIDKIKLVISIQKTEATLFKSEHRLQCYKIENDGLKWNVPLNYLGFEFYGYQTLLKSRNLGAYYREMKSAVKRKNSRVEKLCQIRLDDEGPIYKRKIYRLYTFKGEKTRMLPVQKCHSLNGKVKIGNFERKYRGNYIRYVYRASKEMEAPEMKRQVRKHWRILKSYIDKYPFSNK